MYICNTCKKKYDALPERPKNIFPLLPYIMRNNDDVCACGGTIFEMIKCPKCGEMTSSEYALCDKCFDEYKTQDMALEIGDDWNENLSINGFLANCFSKVEIELMLTEALKNLDEATLQDKILEYCNYDEDFFKEYAEKIWKNSKK